MSNWKNLLTYVDSMLVVDRDLKIFHANRFSTRFNRWFIDNNYETFVGKPFFEVYSDIDPSESSIMECLQTGKIVIKEKQHLTHVRGQVYVANNIAFPIIRFGEVVGVVELSQDITSVGDLESPEERSVLRKTVSVPEKESKGSTTFDSIITNNADMLQCIRKAKLFALTEDPILIYGETGTGKEMFVEAMVNENKARRKNYIVQNCAAIPESLYESILFGSTKGAFNGAENKIGLFEMANGGVLFLDELNSMPLHLQPKLLRVLQDGKIRPIGSHTEKRVNVKVIAAMNKNPLSLMKDKLLREDLFYRLSSSMLNLIALRDRKEDIPLYIDYFTRQLNLKYDKRVAGVSSDLRDILLRYHWPGNVRELRHVLESIINISNEEILTVKDLPAYLKEAIKMPEDMEGRMPETENPLQFRKSLKEMMEYTEREYISRALTYCGGNVSRAAKLLELPRQTLKFRMDKLRITNWK